MIIPGITPQAATTPLKDSRKIKVNASPKKVSEEMHWERRRHPERRRHQTRLSRSERRLSRDRRQPKLLNAHSAKPEPVSSQKGRTINTSV